MCSRPKRKKQWKKHVKCEAEEKKKQENKTDVRFKSAPREMVTGGKPIIYIGGKINE